MLLLVRCQQLNQKIVDIFQLDPQLINLRSKHIGYLLPPLLGDLLNPEKSLELAKVGEVVDQLDLVETVLAHQLYVRITRLMVQLLVDHCLSFLVNGGESHLT